jgi:hypothetical protein
MNFGVHPFILIAAVSALAALVTIVIAYRAKSGLITAMMLALALVFIAPTGFVLVAFKPELIDGRFRAYKRFYRDIQVGMTREQVFEVMEERYPTNGLRKRPLLIQDTPQGLGFFMNPETSSEPNCEGIFITLEAGRVSNLSYSAD